MLGLSIPVSAQSLQADFSGTDLTGWQGDLTKFTIDGGRLRLQDAAAGSSNTAYLSIAAPTTLGEATFWECWLRLDFSPSASNVARIYLSASQSDLTAPQEGYYLRIGGISGDQDAIELFRQDGNNSTLLLSGMAGGAGGNSVLARVRVSRAETGQWSLQVDYNGTENYQQEGTIQDDTYPMGRYFGVYCQYSSTRADAFYFDDILVDPLFADQEPPQLLSATPLDAYTLDVLFDEALAPATAADPSLYNLSGGRGEPASADLSVENPALLHLQWDQAFANLQTYTLTATGVADAAGNTAAAQSVDFLYVETAFPQAGELLITELMPDPSPPLGLPNAEYIELYNTSDKVLELEGVGISTGTTPKRLPAFQLLPKSYLLLVDVADEAAFASYGALLPVSGLPALTNGGDQVSLTSRNDEPLLEINYDLSWYRNVARADGGWSLELIDPGQYPHCPGNWIASQAPAGGTPATANSVLGNILEKNGPVLLAAYAENDLEIVLRFDEALDAVTAAEPTAYSISGGTTVSAAFPQPDRREVLLTLSSPLESGTTYEVQATSLLTDCLGNAVQEPVMRRVGLAEAAKAGDVVINEILFYPQVGGVDFIELYNRSDRTINLRDWRINNRQPDGTDRSAIIEADFLIFPGEYAVLTEEPQDILDRYTVPFPERLLANELPTMGDDGQLSLHNAAFVLIDSFAYSADLHSPLLNDERGVSLERLDSEAPTNSPGNWHSAAGTVGFATPTGQNSQYLPLPERGSNVINLAQKRFSPDGDGYEDVLLFQVTTDRPGYLATIQIFDANGRLVRRLLRNELLPADGIYKWDGAHEDGHKARIGIYVIWLELVNPDGTVERRQESCVLAGKLE